MNFREYRPKQTIRAAEITEEKMQLAPANPEDEASSQPFVKGDYVENRGGVLLGWEKLVFEAAYIPTRAPRTVKANTKAVKRKQTVPPPPIVTGI